MSPWAVFDGPDIYGKTLWSHDQGYDRDQVVIFPVVPSGTSYRYLRALARRHARFGTRWVSAITGLPFADREEAEEGV